MGFWRKFLSVAAPIAGSFFGPVGTAIGAGIGGYLSKEEQAAQQRQAGEQAGQTALGGFNWLNQSPVGTSYLPRGGQAIEQEAALLGLGGDTEAANRAYQNYLNSTGFRAQLHQGQQAITTSRAAAGLLGSGSTAKALTRFGQDLASQSFNNYLSNLRGVSGMGLQAGGMLGQTATQGYGDAARYQYGAGQAAADSSSEGLDQLLAGAGAAYDAWKAGRKPTATAAQRTAVRNALPQLIYR